MSEQMDLETTYQCPTCHCNILSANQFTHDAICARRQATANQRPAQPQIIRRESSSSGLPDAVDNNASRRKPQVREDRVVANNKLVTCPDCEKSVREQHLQSHINTECQGNDKIPCEFCEQAVPMSVYAQHVENTHRREREQEQQQHQQRQEQLRQDQQRQQELHREEEQQQRQRQRSNERPVSPVRGLSSRQNQEERSRPSGRSQERDRSPSHSHPEENNGGFMGFLRNLVHNAAQNRAEPNERPQPVEQPQHRSIFSRLAGLGDHEEQQRSRPLSIEDFFLRAMQGENPQRRNVQSQNPFMSQQQQQHQANRSVRTIRFGPHGTLVISNGRNAMQQEDEPEDYWQTVGVPQQRAQQREVDMGQLSEMGPMGLILQMLASRNQGMAMPFLNQEQMHQLEEKGLSKEDVESLSVVKYDKEKNKNLSEDLKSCPICLDEFEDGVEVKFLWCLHRFHKKCIDQWLGDHTNCPICKKDFSEIEQDFSG